MSNGQEPIVRQPSTRPATARAGISAGVLFFMFLIILLVAVFDQLTKAVVVGSLHEGELIRIVPSYFNLTLTYNRGAAFGILSNYSDGTRQLLLAGTTILALSAVMFFLYYDYYHDRIAQVALAMIVGGALGNVIDRVRIGEVVDFLDFYYQSYHWPAFNVADSAICLGVFILLLRRPARAHSEAGKSGEKQVAAI
jgi:signal peptidase II